MKISYSWLQDYIDIKEAPAELAIILTSLGLEVEGIEEVESIPGSLEGLVIGEVLTCEKHPNADRLSITTVNIGDGTPLHIICGAPNVTKGQKVIVATIGTTLHPITGEPFKIKKGKIRGEVSEGMICAEDEIGIGTDHSGIIVLPDDVAVGTSANSYYDIEKDTVFDIGLTPNRSDASSHIGVARDLAAYFAYHKEQRQLKIPDLQTFSEGTDDKISVKVIDTIACPRYSGISMTNINIKPSPKWMQNRLKAIGVRPISNIVDITNYVLHEYGQPLHAFDEEDISNDSVVVQQLPDGTKFTTLDEVERNLAQEDLMICDGQNNGMCIAGVFGGTRSGVKANTQNVFLESAHFDALSIRKTSTRHNLRTDAARCYEKGSDPNITVDALKRACLLMQEFADAKITSKLVDIYPEVVEPKKVVLRYSRINKLIGNSIPKQKVELILKALEMRYSTVDDDTIEVQIPTNKADVLREADVIEEILRIYGFDQVVIDNRIHTAINPSVRPNLPLLREILTQRLVGKGFNEIMGLSLVPSKLYDNFETDWSTNMVYINNTSNIHLDAMRPEMMVSGLQSVLYNNNRQQRDLCLFEFGNTYQDNDGEYIQKEYLTIIVTGQQESESWLLEARGHDFFSIKRVVHELLVSVGITQYQSVEVDDERFDYGLRYHHGPHTIVQFGKVSSKVQKGMQLKSEIYFAELSLAQILRCQKKNVIEVIDVPKFPSSRRDLALIVDSQVRYDDIAAIVRKNSGKLLSELNLFDVFQDDKVLGEEKKSYAISMIFVDKEKSLKDKQIDKIVQKIVNQLEQQLGAALRK